MLFEADAEKAYKILKRPRQHLSLCDASAIEAQEELVKEGLLIKKKVGNY